VWLSAPNDKYVLIVGHKQLQPHRQKFAKNGRNYTMVERPDILKAVTHRSYIHQVDHRSVSIFLFAFQAS
ncbi:MAG: hypothetical protein AAFO63_11975, partial [Pseudomonadota bacterium]